MTRELTPELLDSVARGLKKTFFKLYEGVEIGAWEKLFSRETSNGAGENYPVLGATPMIAPFQGSRQYSGLRTDGFYVVNEEFDAGLAVARAEIERDNLGKYSGVIQQMAMDAKTHVVSLLAAVLANGTNANLAKCWDGKPLFHAQHGKDGGKNQSNIVSGSGVDTLAHVQTDIEQSLAKMATWKTDKGGYVRGIVPNVALYPAANYGLGLLLKTIAAGRTDLGTADQSGMLQDVIAVPELSGNSWYLANGGGGLRPFGYQVEKDATPETEVDFDTKTVKMAVELRCAVFCADWMRIVQVSNAG
jgi:phage major head subunit gpT-like protein